MNSHPWEKVLSYTGRRSVDGETEPRYLGAGTIGNIGDTGDKPGRYRLLRHEPVGVLRFPVPVKDLGGEYLESDANNTQYAGLYFSQRVQRNWVDSYKRILRAHIDRDSGEEPD